MTGVEVLMAAVISMGVISRAETSILASIGVFSMLSLSLSLSLTSSLHHEAIQQACFLFGYSVVLMLSCHLAFLILLDDISQAAQSFLSTHIIRPQPGWLIGSQNCRERWLGAVNYFWLRSELGEDR